MLEYESNLKDYQGSLEKKLDLSQVIDQDKKSVEPFECPICTYIVSEDMVGCMNSINEVECEAIFCKSCIGSWKKKSVKCPWCQGMLQEQRIPRKFINAMKQSVFNCELKD